MILDFKDCVASVVSNRRTDTNGKVVQWQKKFTVFNTEKNFKIQLSLNITLMVNKKE